MIQEDSSATRIILRQQLNDDNGKTISRKDIYSGEIFLCKN